MNFLKTPRIIKLERILNDLDPKQFSNILDVGCGNGYITENILMNYFSGDFYGIDVKGIEKAKNKGIKAYKMDLNKQERFHFDNDFFDLVFAGEIIEHLVDPDLFLTEVSRILKKNGILIITTPNLASWLNRIVFIFGFQPFMTDASYQYPYVGKLIKKEGKGEHLRVFSYKAITELLKIYGYEILDIKGTYVDEIKTSSFFYLIERISWKIPSISSGLIIVCKKGNIK